MPNAKSAADALLAALGGPAVASLAEAGIDDYIHSLLDEGADETDEDLTEALGPLLIDTGVAEDEVAADSLSACVLKELRGGSAVVASAEPEFRKLAGEGVSMHSLVAADEATAVAETRAEIGSVQINVNTTISHGGPVNTLIEEDESEEAMARRFKAVRRGEKQLKRDARREKVRAMARDEFMRELTREPVVLHWRGGGGGGSSDILLKGVSMDLNGLVLLDDVDVTLVHGRKYGLIGRNGVGKTTFLKFLCAHQFDGIPERLQILHIEQEVPMSEQSVLETVLATDMERTALLEEARELDDEADVDSRGAVAKDGDAADEAVADEAERQARLLEVHERLEEIDAHTAPSRAGAILSGLGFEHDMQQRPVRSFSGGWRMRVALARALFVAPDVLLLDEPTNHLDLHAVLWLETYLQGWDKTLVVVSHARSFLNAVVTDILHFSGDRKIQRYKGDYDHFEATRAEALRNSERAREAQEKTRAHMQAFIDRFRAQANRAAMVQSRIKALGRMENIAEVLADPTLRFSFPEPEPLSPPVLQISNVGFAYEGREPLFSKVCLGLDMTSRVALVGPNGVGKSTLLKVIMGELEPTTGDVTRHGRLRMGRFTQHHVDQLDLSLTALEAFQKAYPNAKPLEIRAHLGGMGLGGNTALQKMATLSGGQKSRVAFAQIMWQRPHLLLLDEPTNHLDLDAVEALIHALVDCSCGLLVISHDAHLVSSICEELWVAEPGTVSIYRGEFEQYRRQQLKLTKKVGLLNAGKHVTAGSAAADDDAPPQPPPSAPKGKIEIMPAGKRKT